MASLHALTVLATVYRQSDSAKFTAFYAFPLVETVELLVRRATSKRLQWLRGCGKQRSVQTHSDRSMAAFMHRRFWRILAGLQMPRNDLLHRPTPSSARCLLVLHSVTCGLAQARYLQGSHAL